MNNVCACRLPIAPKIVRLYFKDALFIRCLSSKQNLSTFYDTLNLKPGCTKKEIRNAFIKLSKLNHPDICGPSSNDRFIRINEAYNVLNDESKKKIYDKTLNYHSVKRYPIYRHYPQKQNSCNQKNGHDSNYWLTSNISIIGICISLVIIGSIVRLYGVKKSAFIRNFLQDESDECLTFLEEQKLMKVGKSKDELLQMFENNIEKEYGHIVKK